MGGAGRRQYVGLCLFFSVLAVMFALLAAVGKPIHRISQKSAMSDHISIERFEIGCYEL